MVLSVFILELISTNKKKFTIVKIDHIPDDNQKCTRHDRKSISDLTYQYQIYLISF